LEDLFGGPSMVGANGAELIIAEDMIFLEEVVLLRVI